MHLLGLCNEAPMLRNFSCDHVVGTSQDHGKAMAKDLADTKAKNLQLESALKEMQVLPG